VLTAVYGVKGVRSEILSPNKTECEKLTKEKCCDCDGANRAMRTSVSDGSGGEKTLNARKNIRPHRQPHKTTNGRPESIYEPSVKFLFR
jgi:hypothetical protein